MRKPLKMQRHLRVNRVINTPPAKAPDPNAERLVSAAIIRDDEVHIGPTHAHIRSNLGDRDPVEPKRHDREGFFTDRKRFVDRSVARMIAIDAGQVPPNFSRELLSSDVRW